MDLKRMTGDDMGYDLHITRADHWPDSALYPISYEEWAAVADTEPALTPHPIEGHRAAYTFARADGRTWATGWRAGQITIWKAYDASPELAAIAARLGARLVGDDSEEYHADGTHSLWTTPRPTLLRRPLSVDEVAAAWETVFDRDFEDGASWRPAPGHARHALSAFRTIAGCSVATPAVADAEGLRYRYSSYRPSVVVGTPDASASSEAAASTAASAPAAGAVAASAEADDEPVLRVQLIRQFATDADSGITLVTCRLDFARTAAVAALGATLQTWFPGDGPTRDAWLDSIAARPEWQVLDEVAPLSVTFETVPLA